MSSSTQLDRRSVDFQQATVVIGLEVHVQLLTQSKLFCGCSAAFGGEPNTQTCPVCTGMPGSLPVLNEHALELSIKTGLALNCKIAEYTKWDRKNYFYPDLPKGYQISQFDLPICRDGFVDISSPKNEFDSRRVHLERAHLEEDAGKSLHDEAAGQGKSKIDLNRTGTPLLEIVTKPDMRSAAEAKAFLTELKLILTYIRVSDCNMQEGSLRCDANVNLHIPLGSQTVATPIVEIKNLNSFRAAERAITYEAQRQFDAWKESGATIGDIPKQTRGWDDGSQTTQLQREKEESADYRYFPDPDLIGYRTTGSQIEALRQQIGLLPGELRRLLESDHQLSPYDADVLVSQGRGVVEYFLEVANVTGNSKMAANWVGQEVLRHLNEQEGTIEQYPVSAADMTALLTKIIAGDFDQTRGKEVLNEMVEHRIGLDTAIEKLGIVSVGVDEMAALAQQLIDNNEAIAQQIREGNTKAVGALIGQARKLNPNASPGAIKDQILRILTGA